jgi:hypothetical protein
MRKLYEMSSDLPVLNLAALNRPGTPAGAARFEPSLVHALLLVTCFAASIGIAQAQAASGHPSVLTTLL